MRVQGAALAITILAAAVNSSEAGASMDGPLFAADDVLSITLTGPLARSARIAPPAEAAAGLIELEDGTAFPVRFTRYGLNRRLNCTFLPFAITLAAEHTRGTPFEGILRLRLVAPCHLSPAYERYVLLEYLVYASYGIVARPGLRVRLVRCLFRDSDRPASEETVLAFFLEDLGEDARRLDLEWLDIATPDTERIDSEQLAVLALFQFMVGNTDWSAMAAAPGERCCHNVAILGRESARYDDLVPFDFDQTGIVDAPYAEPDQSLKIRQVTDRLYRGFCWHNAELPEAVRILNEKRIDLKELYDRDDLPLARVRKQAWRYLDSSYDILNDPKKFSRHILQSCR